MIRRRSRPGEGAGEGQCGAPFPPSHLMHFASSLCTCKMKQLLNLLSVMEDLKQVI